MIRIAIYLLGVGLVTIPATGAPAPKPTKEDLVQAELAKLEGTWKAVSCQIDGEEAPAEAIASMSTVKVKGSEYSFSSGQKGKITMIDPTTSPKTVDYKNDGDDDELTTQTGIYKLEGDTFIDCITFGGKDRPKEFISKKGTGHILTKYERVKERKQ
jgi:uncharacterized protein (TIGR03067 family)